MTRKGPPGSPSVLMAMYVYRVPRERVAPFVRIHEQAKAILVELGALDCHLYAPSDVTPKYHCTSFAQALAAAEDELVYVECDDFRDREHLAEVMARVDADERIARLFEQLRSVVQIERAVRGEFERVL